MNKKILFILLTSVALNNPAAFAQKSKSAGSESSLKKIMTPAPDPLTKTLEAVKVMEKQYLQEQMKVDAETFDVVQDLKDPFIPQIPQDNQSAVPVPVPVTPITTQPAIPGQVAEPQLPMPQFNISGLVFDTERPQAIINNQVYDQGDIINNWTIVEINPQGVRVTFRNQVYFIEKMKP